MVVGIPGKTVTFANPQISHNISPKRHLLSPTLGFSNQSPPRNDVSKGELVKYHESDGDTLYFHFGLLQLSTFLKSQTCQSDGGLKLKIEMNIMFEAFSQNHVFIFKA